jgi:hypothetical protein
MNENDTHDEIKGIQEMLATICFRISYLFMPSLKA